MPFFSIGVQGNTCRYYFCKIIFVNESAVLEAKHGGLPIQFSYKRLRQENYHSLRPCGEPGKFQGILNYYNFYNMRPCLRKKEGEGKRGRRRENMKMKISKDWVCSRVKGCMVIC